MKNYLFGLLTLIYFISCSKGEAPAPVTPTPPAVVLEIGEFALELPENNKECESGVVNGDKSEVEFKWKTAKNATKYELKLTDLLTGSSVTYPDIATNSKVITLSRGKSYAWTITASNSSSKPLTSSSWKFYLAGDGKSNRAPAPATAIYPVPGSTVRLNSAAAIKFEWSSQDPDKDVLTYTLRIDTLNNKTFSGTSLESKNPSLELKLLPGKIYYWSVISKDESIGIQSDTFTFLLK